MSLKMANLLLYCFERVDFLEDVDGFFDGFDVVDGEAAATGVFADFDAFRIFLEVVEETAEHR